MGRHVWLTAGADKPWGEQRETAGETRKQRPDFEKICVLILLRHRINSGLGEVTSSRRASVLLRLRRKEGLSLSFGERPRMPRSAMPLNTLLSA